MKQIESFYRSFQYLVKDTLQFSLTNTINQFYTGSSTIIKTLDVIAKLF
jgi:hypothetical protein